MSLILCDGQGFCLHVCVIQGESGVPPTPSVLHASTSRASHTSRAELEGDKPAVELTVHDERSVAGSSNNEIDNLMDDIKGKLSY